GDPAALVSGKDGRVVWAQPPCSRGRIVPLALPGAKKVFARLGENALGRFRTSDREEWSVPVSTTAGPLVATAPIESGASPALVLADGRALRRFSVDGTEQTDAKKGPWLLC